MSSTGVAVWHWRDYHRPSLATSLYMGQCLLALPFTPWQFHKGIHQCQELCFQLRAWEKSKSSTVSGCRQPGAGKNRAATAHAVVLYGRTQRNTGLGSWGLKTWAASCKDWAA